MKRGLLRAYASGLSVLSRVADVAAVLAGGELALWLRFHGSAWGRGALYQTTLLVAVLLAVAVFPGFGVYRSWRARGLRAPAMRTLAAWVVVFAATLLVLVAFKKNDELSRWWFAAWFGCTAVMLVVLRATLYLALRSLRARGYNLRRAVIVGDGEQARALLRRSREPAWAGFQVDALFAAVPGSPVGADVPVHPLDGLRHFLALHPVDEVWISLPLEQTAQLDEVLGQLQCSTANVRYVPDLRGLFLLNRGVTELLDTPMLDLCTTPIHGVDEGLKRLEDIVLAALILVAVSPLVLLIAIGVKLSSPGPVLFRQRRHGWSGRAIEIWKFRTMHAHAEAPGQVTQARRDDPRLTPFGAFLRRTSLDELPQFINVLQGRMSIVGPRPHAVEHNAAFETVIEHYALRHKVKPGITGWAQVNGWRGETETVEKMRRRVEHDLYYIEHWSLGFDLRIIGMTLVHGFIGRNAY